MGKTSLKPKRGEGTVADSFRYVPSTVHVNHANNFSRADNQPVPEELKPYIEGDTFCFTLAEVEQRMREFVGRVSADEKADPNAPGQITPGTIYLTKTCDAFLVDGYLRHAAWLLAEVRGLIPGKKRNVFQATKIAQPQTPEDWDAIRRRNYAENNSRKDLTPIDRAYYADRLTKSRAEGGQGLSREAAAHEMGLTNSRQLNRYLSLLALPPNVQAAVHRGEVSMSKALSKASKTGQGTGRGPRAGIRLAAARKRLAVADDPALPESITPRELLLAQLISGAIDVDDYDGEIPEDLQEFVALLDTPPKPSKAAKPSRLAPPKPVEA